jgi:purine-binding chemotaxis protein CheW
MSTTALAVAHEGGALVKAGEGRGNDTLRPICTFRLAGSLFGIEVTQVQEVLREQPMTRVPLAPPEIRGLINLRGQIVTAIDLRDRLNLPPPQAGHSPMNVVVQTEHGVASLLVDAIGDVIDVADRELERTPETVPRTLREICRGVYKLPGELVLLLDPDRAIHSDAATRAAATESKELRS